MSPAAALHVDDKREAILGAALELFAELGFHGTAVPQIAERASVGAGTIYRYFESKEGIVNALYQRHKAALGAALMDDFPYEAPARAQLDHLVARVFAFAKKHPFALKFLEAHHHASYLDEESRALEARLLEPARLFFERQARARLTKKATTEVLFSLMWGALMGVVRASWEGLAVLDVKTQRTTSDALWDTIRRTESGSP